jgi:hypothetical protein
MAHGWCVLSPFMFWVLIFAQLQVNHVFNHQNFDLIALSYA